ncbi:MAG: type II toxin-antitoxin system VapC family toxin [Bryobacteraceae bacterium]
MDANVLMYAAGTDHPHKGPSLVFLERVADGSVDAAIDAEVLQEILHRYSALKRWQDGRRVYELARRLFPVVQPVTAEVLDRAKTLVDADPGLSARDAVHAAVVLVYKAESICSFDKDFDRVAGCRRIIPE